MSSQDARESLPPAPFAARGPFVDIELGATFAPKFDADGLIPVVAVEASSGEVLMVAYMNAESLTRTLEVGEAVYWSRSRKQLWHKGATSGHVQKLVELRVDCDQDCLLMLVESLGAGACHNGYRSCFYRRIADGSAGVRDLESAGVPRVFDPAAVYGKPG